MREIINFFKELCLLKKEENTMVGLSSFKRTTKPIARKPVKKEPKEMKLSDLMRRSSSLS